MADRETVVTVVTKGLQEQQLEAGIACLVVFYGADIGKRYFLDKSEQIIGRSDSVNIQVDQESVSRKHARIAAREGRSFINDMGSTNGTFVNDVQISDAELRDGDLVRVGQTIFKYLSGTNIESKYHEEIYRLTTIDGLTQCYNKRYFIETLEREINRAVRYQRVLSLVMMDVDYFKRINDTHGHLAGDHVLRELATLIAGHIRREDIFARYGGEEFSLILPEIDEPHALPVCEKIRRLVEQQTFQFAGVRIPVTISLGLCCLGPELVDVSPTDLIAVADAKLYEAKQGGRNRVVS